MPSVTMIFSVEIMSTLKEIKYYLKQSYHKQKLYPLPYPTPNLSYPLAYPTLPFTLPLPLPLTYPTLPCTLPYAVPYPTLSYPILFYSTLPYPTLPPTMPYPIPTPYPTLNRPVNLPSMYFSHVRYSLMSISVFSCVIFGKLGHCVDLKPWVGFWLSC